MTGDFSFKKRLLPLWEKHKVLFAHPCSKVGSQHHVIKWKLCSTKAQIIKYVFGWGLGVFSPFFFLYLLKKKPNPNSHRSQEFCPSRELQTAQASNCLWREQWIFPRGELIKKCSLQACLGPRAHRQGDFCYQPAPPGTPSPLPSSQHR